MRLSGKLSLAVLISGRGSNLQALIDACEDPGFPAAIKIVVSNRPAVYGLERAQNHNIPVQAIDHKQYSSRETFEDALSDALERHAPDLICLAGFMRVLTPHFIRRWEGKIINIHPSLLPAYKGVDTHARVLADGGAESGCSVHYVTAELDSGPVIVQRRVPVLPGDTPDILAARILEQEHIAYPEAVRRIAETMNG
ncbi:MAG: phosphoribosylglycinamide formyltransferase [Alphaproteobacteria bacterium]|nr:phosphoribosylglycinamide formyltransferase [Alphaproteobacteria bacterium]